MEKLENGTIPPFELRTYTVEKGKQAAVNAFIAKSGVKYMAKHNIELVGAWVPVDAADERIITIVAHKDKATGEKNVAAFMADEEFRTAIGEVMKDGPVIASIARFYLNATDYSPAIKPANVGDRVFEMRTYIATPDAKMKINTAASIETSSHSLVPRLHHKAFLGWKTSETRQNLCKQLTDLKAPELLMGFPVAGNPNPVQNRCE